MEKCQTNHEMFAYDSVRDEYNKVSNSDFSDTDGESSEPTIAIVCKRSNLLKSRLSIRSYSRNVITPRVINKTGRLNTFLTKRPNKRALYIRDLGNTLLHIRWRWILATVCLVNFLSFFLFGLLWQLVATISGDLEENAVDFCVVNAKSYAGYLLLGIETLMTIGYGYRYPTEKCQLGWLLQASQAFFNVLVQGALISAVYVKIAKPFTKNSLALFSPKAVICLRDGQLCLIVRLIDLVGKVSVGTNITMYFVDKQESDDDTPFRMQQIKVEPHGLLIFPLEIVHVIDADSPLWKTTPLDLLTKRCEVVVVAEGSSMVTGQLSQNRTSYTNADILWGHRFAPCVEFDDAKLKYIVNCKEVNRTRPFDTPLCSAQELNAIARDLPSSD